ncbi:MAG: HAD family hydrolase [Lachnospiraceae bacterium]|nr:HAD family hydrolase [Lachnospiraceae bacterium]
MKEYRNYIFDLYGTLIDLNVDERSTQLWTLLAGFYNVYGCDVSAAELKDVFFKADKEERELLKKERGLRYPEIRLEKVFSRLLFECGKDHPVSASVAGLGVDRLRAEYAWDKERVINTVLDSEWCMAAANLFRVASRQYIRLFPDTLKVLDGLKKRGKKVYLLSNAQKIFTMPEIEAFGLDERFDAMYISSDHYMMKPDTGFMDILLENEKLDRSECVMVGDDPVNDGSIAVNSGMDCILINRIGKSKEAIMSEIGKVTRGGKAAAENTVSICEHLSDALIAEEDNVNKIS